MPGEAPIFDEAWRDELEVELAMQGLAESSHGVWRDEHTWVRSVYEDQAGELDGEGNFAREIDFTLPSVELHRKALKRLGLTKEGGLDG